MNEEKEKNKCSTCCHAVNRRKAIELGAQTLSAIGFLSASSHLLSACGPQKPLSPGTGNGSGANPVASGNASTQTATDTSTQTGTTTQGTVFSFANNAALSKVGGSISATLNTSNGQQDVYITRVSTTSAITVSVICTHEACNINSYDASRKQYFCACHGSVFGADGSVIRGPASSSLATFPTSLTESGVTVTPG